MKSKIKPRIQLEDRESLADNIPLSTPWVVFVDPSDVCNFKCKFCPSSDRELLKKVGRPLTFMDFDLYKKIIDDICKFDKPIKVLRLYLHGEPLLNSNFSKMVKYAKDSGCCEKVDTTTNGSMLNPKLNLEIIEAGLDRINISVQSVSEKDYETFSGYKIDYKKFVDNITHFYDNRGNCEMIIKTNGDILTKYDIEMFYEIFGDICDSIFVEHAMNCWYNFNGVKENEEVGLYGQHIKRVDVCPYVFYSMSINSDGTVSLCFLDWARKLLIGDVKTKSIKNIWNGEKIKQFQKLFLLRKRNKLHICNDCSQLTHGMPVDLDKVANELYLKLWGKEV